MNPPNPPTGPSVPPGPAGGHRDTALRADAVGVRDLVFFVLSAAAPLTVMAGFSALAFLLGGVAAPTGYLIAGAVFALFAVGFTAMSRHMRNSGAFYAYISRGLGPVAGAGAALIAYLAYALGQIGFGAVAGLFAADVLRVLTGFTVPWQMCAVALLLLIALLSYLKVDIGARVLALLLVAEIGVLLVLAVAVLAQGGHEGLTAQSFNPAHLMTPGVAGLFVITFVVYIGFEQTAIYSEEARDAPRTVPRATYLAVAILAVLYTFVSWIILMAAGPHRLTALLAQDPADLVFDLNTEYVGGAMTSVMRLLIVTSFLAGVLALQNAGCRYLFSLGRDGILPAAFARTNPRTRTPSTAGLVHTGLVVAAVTGFGLTSLDPYTQIVVWTNTPTLVGVLLLEIATSIAVIRYLGRLRSGESLWQRLVAPALSAVLLTAVAVLVVTKMSLLTGLTGAGGNALVLSPLMAGLIAGCARALWLRANRPDVYRRLSDPDPQSDAGPVAPA
ncbi:APC family permease [Kitasatospora sp. NPDC093550]|uniref:APC family permease n=1 Tax=Kitasatospora sp. NPDC093550 TaxID=3364089 RepID=UPI0037F897E6